MNDNITVVLLNKESGPCKETLDSLTGQSSKYTINIIIADEYNVNEVIDSFIKTSKSLIFIEDGDILEDTMIEKLSSGINGVFGLAYCDEVVYNELGKLKKFKESYDRKRIEHTCYIPKQSMIRSDILKLAGKPYIDESLGPCKYWDLWLRATEHCLAMHIPEFLFITKQNECINTNPYVYKMIEKMNKRKEISRNASK